MEGFSPTKFKKLKTQLKLQILFWTHRPVKTAQKLDKIHTPDWHTITHDPHFVLYEGKGDSCF
jgi:hypothetical protein